MAIKEQGDTSIAEESVELASGERLAYYDSKETHGLDAAIVLLHGYCGSSAYWEKVVDELAAAFRVIAPDARGHGRSSTPADAAYTMEQYAGDVEELLKRLDADRVILLGHSLGGYITLAYAEAYPNRLAAFGLIHSTPLPDSKAARGNRDAAVATLEGDGVAAFVDGLVPKLFAAERIGEMGPEVERSKEIGRSTSLHGAVATAKGMKVREDRRAVVDGADMPVLLIAGLQDGVIPPESTFSAGNDGARKVELHYAGHMSMMECPQQLAEEILSFARTV